MESEDPSSGEVLEPPEHGAKKRRHCITQTILEERRVAALVAKPMGFPGR